MSPRVSIITRTKNRGLLLRRSVESVLSQTHADWQLVIVNDGGDRSHVDPLLLELEPRLRGRALVVHHETSKGMEAATNAGIRASSGELIALLDDDDTWHPDFLKETVGFLDANTDRSVRGVVSHAAWVKERIEGDVVTELSRTVGNAHVRAVPLVLVLSHNPFPVHSFVYERGVIDEIGFYREDFPVAGDWQFLIRFVSKYDVGVVPKVLAFYHQRESLLEGQYSNSIIATNDKLRHYEAKMFNELLRADLESGRAGLGHLASIARELHDLRERIRVLERRTREARPWTMERVRKSLYRTAKNAGLVRGRSNG
ncbi:MAG: glycosyltransferase [Polyangiales bacterium]